jgi:hypothetical protein
MTTAINLQLVHEVAILDALREQFLLTITRLLNDIAAAEINPAPAA